MSCTRHLRRLSTAAAAATANTAAPAAAAAGSISICQAKSKLQSEFDPDKAVEIYTYISKDDSFNGSSRYAQELAVRRLAKSRRFSDIEALIESHKSDPRIKDETYLSTLIRSYGRAGMFDHALRTFSEMEQFGTPRSTVSFNALLTACNACKLFDKVPGLLAELSAKYGIVPDKVSYGVLVKSYCEAGSPEKGIEVLREMEEKGVEVTAVTFTTILDKLYKSGRTDEAEKLWADMVSKGCELDAIVYNVKLLNAQDAGPESVQKIIEEMEEKGVKPDTCSYNCLMTSYCKLGMMDDAKKVYEGLRGNGCKPNAATFRTLVHYRCEKEQYKRAYWTFKESVRADKIPDFVTLKVLLEGLVEKKYMEEAKGLLRTVKKKFPSGYLNAWKKVEESLGLASPPAAAAAAAAGMVAE